MAQEGETNDNTKTRRKIPVIYEVIAVLVIVLLFLFLTLFGIGNYPRP